MGFFLGITEVNMETKIASKVFEIKGEVKDDSKEEVEEIKDSFNK